MILSDIPYSLVMYLLILSVIVGVIVYFMYNTPKYSRVNEGFFGGVARGSGHPDCLRTLPEASEILEFVMPRINTTSNISDGPADFNEFQLILSKLACLKKDLMSPSGIVNSTKYQSFETAHDRINVAEVCAMCLNQTISPRDLDIVFATWRDRGKVLLRKLCTEANLKEDDVRYVEKLFNSAWSDVYDISQSKCLSTNFSKQKGGSTGGDVAAYEPEDIKDMRSYTNTYNGMSASGWNGAV